MNPSRPQVLSLLRSLLRFGSKITNYNFREHAKRRALQGFRANRGLSGNEAQIKYDEGLIQLNVLKRQSVISQLYPDMGSVISGGSKMHE